MQSQENQVKRSTKLDRCVPSRYKQGILSKSSSSSSSSKGSISQLKVNQSSSSDASTSGHGITPFKGQQRPIKKIELTSTPTPDSAGVLSFDASSIVADQPSMPELKEPLLMPSTKKKGRKYGNSAAHNVNITGVPKQQQNKDKGEVVMSEIEVDILYAQYVQAVFLESRAKKCLENKSKDAIASFHKLWTLNNAMREELRNQELELDAVLHLKHLLEYFKQKKKVYECANQTLSVAVPQYEQITEAVESARNTLQAPNILFSSEEVIPLVEELKSLIGEFLTSMRPDEAELPITAALMWKLSSLIDDIDSELVKCSNILATAEHLGAKESSLKIADMQIKGMK